MKGLLLKLAGGYAGLGALAFLIHRARYLRTSELRDWTDRRSHVLEAQLGELRRGLLDLRRALHPPLDTPGASGTGERRRGSTRRLTLAARQVGGGGTPPGRPAEAVEGHKKRRPARKVRETPDGGKLAA